MKTDKKKKEDCGFVSRSLMPLRDFGQLSTRQHQVSTAPRSTVVPHIPQTLWSHMKCAAGPYLHGTFKRNFKIHIHTPLFQRHDLEVKHATFRRMTSFQVITFGTELKSTSCQPRTPQHTLVMARKNSWQVRPDEFWNPVNRYKNYLHKIHCHKIHETGTCTTCHLDYQRKKSLTTSLLPTSY